MLRLPLADALNEEHWKSRRISNLSASTEPCPAVWKMNRRSRKQEIPVLVTKSEAGIAALGAPPDDSQGA